MIIISQDKKCVVNSDNISRIYIDYLYDIGRNSNIFSEDAIDKVLIKANGVTIAKYDTEKEAMDTLNELSAMLIAGNKDYVIE